MRIAYAGENGQPYTAIGRTLIAKGALSRETVSLQSIRAWLLAHPDQARRRDGDGQELHLLSRSAAGRRAPGQPRHPGRGLTPLASLAVDPRLNALGAPFYVAADGADPVQALMMAQDTGGAIRGAVRGDIFFGFGAEAEDRAGAHEGAGPPVCAAAQRAGGAAG